MFETNPRYQSDTETEIKYSFKRDGEYDEEGSESEEYYYQPVKVVVVGLKSMEEG